MYGVPFNSMRSEDTFSHGLSGNFVGIIGYVVIGNSLIAADVTVE